MENRATLPPWRREGDLWPCNYLASGPGICRNVWQLDRDLECFSNPK